MGNPHFEGAKGELNNGEEISTSIIKWQIKLTAPYGFIWQWNYIYLNLYFSSEITTTTFYELLLNGVSATARGQLVASLRT